MKIRKSWYVLWAVPLLALCISAGSVQAKFLLQSARHFHHGGLDHPNNILLADVTVDGITDIVLAGSIFNDWSYPLVATFPGTGDGSVAEPLITESTVGDGEVREAAMALVNGDQHPDLLLNASINAPESNVVLVLLGNGDGTFAVSSPLTLGFNSYRLVAADFTGDGIVDFAVNESTDGSWAIHTYEGAGDGSFSFHGTTSMAKRPDNLVAGDFDDDGDTDMAAGVWMESVVIRLLNNGSGQFTTSEYSAPATINYMDTGDLNSDGYDDLAAGGFMNGVVGVFFGNADGSLSPFVPFDAGRESTSICL
jgi:hypothetical protein